MQINKIYSVLNTIQTSEKALFPVVDPINWGITVTDCIENSSSFSEIGAFFARICEREQVTTKDVDLLQRSFAVIKQNKFLEDWIKRQKKHLKESGLKVRTDKFYNGLLEEKQDGENIEEQLQCKYEELRKKEPIFGIDILFPKEKQFILQKLQDDLKLTNKMISANVDSMDTLKFLKAHELVNCISKDFEPKFFRKLKQMMVGGLRFSENSKIVTYNVSESALVTKIKAFNNAKQKKTKTRSNHAALLHPSSFPIASVEDLHNKVVSLNETTLSQALMTQLEFYVTQPVRLRNHINELIDEYNNTEKFLQDFSKAEILKYLKAFWSVCNDRYNDLDIYKYDELGKCWKAHMLAAEKAIQEGYQVNCIWVALEPVPAIVEKPIFSYLEMVLRELIFNSCELIKNKTLPRDLARWKFSSEILNRLESDINEQKLDFISELNKNFLAASFEHLSINNPKTTYLIDRLFKTNSALEALAIKTLFLQINTFSKAIANEILLYVADLPQSIRTLNQRISEYNQLLQDEKSELNTISEVGKEVLFRTDFILNEIKWQNKHFSVCGSNFLSFTCDEFLVCNQFYQAVNKINFKELFEDKSRESPLCLLYEHLSFTREEIVILQELCFKSLLNLSKSLKSNIDPSILFQNIFLKILKKEKKLDFWKIHNIQGILGLCFQDKSNNLEKQLNYFFNCDHIDK